MKTMFSFNYDGREYLLDAVSETYKIDENLCVEVLKNEYTEFDACWWQISFIGCGTENSKVISDICDSNSLLPLDIPPRGRPGYMPKDGEVCIITMNGMVGGGTYQCDDNKISALEYQTQKNYIEHFSNKAFSTKNVNGRSSDGQMPFFDITANGGGYIAAIGWSGSWKADFQIEESSVRIKTGLQKTAFYIKPGEKLRTSSFAVMAYSSEENKYNKFRRFIKKYFSHTACTDTDREGLMAFELWGGLDSEKMKKRLSELKEHNIRFEDLWLDAGWYGKSKECHDPYSGDWWGWAGDWSVNERVHPGRLEDVAKTAKECGMNMLLWFEIERYMVTTPVVKEHPQWFLYAKNNAGKDLNFGIINFANTDAINYIAETVSGYVTKLNLSCYRQDFNIEVLLLFCEQNDEENRAGVTEINYINGMYRFWEILLEKHPGLIIDNCASGGRRIDIETLKRSVVFFRSDYQCVFNPDPEVTQVHNSGISKYLPYSGCTTKATDIYSLRSTYSASWGLGVYNAFFQSLSEEEFANIKKTSEEYKRIRKYFSCDFYNHASEVFDSSAWTIWQYDDPENKSGIVMAFRRKDSIFSDVSVPIGGEFTYENLDTGEIKKGSESLEITLPEKRSSAIFEYKR